MLRIVPHLRFPRLRLLRISPKSLSVIALVSCSPARTLSGGVKIKVIEGKSQIGLRSP